MNPILADEALLQFLKDGNYYDFACVTDFSLETTTDIKEVRGPGDGYWRKVRGQRLSYRLNFSSLTLLEFGPPTQFWLMQFQLQMLHVDWKITWHDPVTTLTKEAAGSGLISSSVQAAASTGFATGDFVIEGSGAYTLTDSATTCNATIGLIEIGPGNPDNGSSASVSYEGVTNAARLEYSVDGGPREVIFDPGASGFFYLFGLADGPHTITVWAVCETGVDGESNELVFEVDGGEVAPACAPPGDPFINEIGTDVAVANWDPADPAPAGDYYIEFGPTSTGTVIADGIYPGPYVVLNGLSSGVEYFFRVKSICEAGVSESAFKSVNFTTIGACNVPGTPSMSAITGTTATASWTAPSPAPADGYAWEVLEGVTVVDSGTTAGLSVGLTGLTAGTSYTFRVKSVCQTGVNESGYNSVDFETTGDTQIFWNFNEDLGNGTLVIRKNGVIVVNTTTAGAGNFTAAEDNIIQITLTATTGNITVTDDTTSTEIINEDGSGTFNESFTVELAHDYTINATVTS